MPAFLHSTINLSGTRAAVSDPLAGQSLANVRCTAGFWEATCAQTGALLLPRIERIQELPAPKKSAFGTPKKTIETSLGQIIQMLRPVLCA